MHYLQTTSSHCKLPTVMTFVPNYCKNNYGYLPFSVLSLANYSPMMFVGLHVFNNAEETVVIKVSQKQAFFLYILCQCNIRLTLFPGSSGPQLLSQYATKAGSWEGAWGQGYNVPWLHVSRSLVLKTNRFYLLLSSLLSSSSLSLPSSSLLPALLPSHLPSTFPPSFSPSFLCPLFLL